MKILMLIALLIGICVVQAQDITGDWNGILDVKVMQLTIVFHISETDTGLSATMDSPDQGALGIQVSSVTFVNPLLTLNLESAGILYTGELKDQVIEGSFLQGGQKYPLNLSREPVEKAAYNRPQEPLEPFPYLVEEVTFTNPDADIKLAGTLTLPETKGTFPAVVLISGSGAQDRNEMVFGHKPFLVIADFLARNGIATLRFDDRGTAQSEGDNATATTFDFATDVTSAVAYLKTRKEIGNIGLIGHSEGGIIAPIVASSSPDVDFIILLAGTGIRGDKLLLLQQEAIWRVDGMSEEELQKNLSINSTAFEMVIKASNPDSLETELQDFLIKNVEDGEIDLPEDMSKEDLLASLSDGLTNPWMFNFIRLDPAQYLEKVRCPVLALNGAKDLQVPSQVNLTAIREALEKGGNKNVTVREFPGLNHLFQTAETGSPDEYASIEQTFAPEVLEAMSSWIKRLGEK